jgi:hypothetical protein
MNNIFIFYLLFKLAFSFQYTYIREKLTDPLLKVPICIGENEETIKCSEIPIDLTYPYVLISPNFYLDKSIKDNKGVNYFQEFIDYNYYFYKGIKHQTNFFCKKENIFIKGNNTKLSYISGLQDVNKLGLGGYYGEEKIEDSNELFDYNFINYLYKNNFINDYVFSFEPVSKTETLINIGERINTNFKKCFSSNKLIQIINNSDRIEEKSFWNCQLKNITTTNYDKYFLNTENNFVVFDSISEDIHLPYNIGMEVLNYIKSITNEKCYFEEKTFISSSEIDFSYTYLICDHNADFNKVPTFKFVFEGFELKLGKNVILRPHDCWKNRVNILAYKNLNYIKIGVPILKQYHIIFDYKDNSVGIVQDKSFLFDDIQSNKIAFYCIVLFISVISIILYAIRNNIKKRKINNQLIDYDLHSNELISN